ncbi:MAG: hypothetical protein V4484_11660 [Pseudomonadota bacterium]
MLRTPVFFKLLSLCLLAHVGLATAQQKPSEAPPKLEIIEQGSDTPITIAPPKQGGTKITEKKEGGRVTEVKVKSGKSSYTMKPNNPAGNAQPGDGTSNTLRAPQWTVLEFDLGKKKKTDRENVPEPAPAPPPPAPATK